MSTIHFHGTTTATPEQFVAGSPILDRRLRARITPQIKAFRERSDGGTLSQGRLPCSQG
jgi:hypothetical protein